jgi:hypothetical protein
MTERPYTVGAKNSQKGIPSVAVWFPILLMMTFIEEIATIPYTIMLRSCDAKFTVFRRNVGNIAWISSMMMLLPVLSVYASGIITTQITIYRVNSSAPMRGREKKNLNET